MEHAHQHEDESARARHRAPAPERSDGATAARTALPFGAGNAAVTRLLRQELTAQGAGPLDPQIGSAIDAARGGGSQLPDPVRADMEDQIGVDLSAVRIHTGSTADTLNRSVEARAFTSGTDIFFSGGTFDPHSSGGRELLAHELTHVVQQASGAVTHDGVSHPDDPAEVQARAVGQAIGSTPTQSA